MPSFCPKLESTIKVMHRRMAKNDQKFTKICFSRELSLKSGKINFHEFWSIFGHSTVHHLKNSQNYPKLGSPKKHTFLQKSEKTQNLFFQQAINLPNMSRKSNFFVKQRLIPPNAQKKILQASEQYSRNEPQIPEKNISTEIRTRLKSLPLRKYW